MNVEGDKECYYLCFKSGLGFESSVRLELNEKTQRCYPKCDLGQ